MCVSLACPRELSGPASPPFLRHCLAVCHRPQRWQLHDMLCVCMCVWVCVSQLCVVAVWVSFVVHSLWYRRFCLKPRRQTATTTRTTWLCCLGNPRPNHNYACFLFWDLVNNGVNVYADENSSDHPRIRRLNLNHSDIYSITDKGFKKVKCSES